MSNLNSLNPLVALAVSAMFGVLTFGAFRPVFEARPVRSFRSHFWVGTELVATLIFGGIIVNEAMRGMPTMPPPGTVVSLLLVVALYVTAMIRMAPILVLAAAAFAIGTLLTNLLYLALGWLTFALANWIGFAVGLVLLAGGVSGTLRLRGGNNDAPGKG